MRNHHLLATIFISLCLANTYAYADEHWQSALRTWLNAAEKPQDSSDPIWTAGHGAMLGRDGKVIETTKAFVVAAQTYYRNQLELQLNTKDRRDLQAFEKHVARNASRYDADSVQREALLINWMLERVPTALRENYTYKIKTLNMRYALDILDTDTRQTQLEYFSGLSAELLQGMGIKSRKTTNANGQEYVEECTKAGVPIPPDFLDDNWDDGRNWTFTGELNPDFLTPNGVTDVYVHRSESPAGTCIALPRKNNDNVDLMGVICLGQETGNACFWDRATPKFLWVFGGTAVGDELNIDDFVGGTDLSNGVCSDCHAGENPFIIHPGSSLDVGVTALSSPNWHDPLMKPSWPKNPGPNQLLQNIELNANENSCLDCHTNLYAGRFPEVGLLPGYCGSVLAPAINQTMPPRESGMSNSEYNTYKASFQKHSEALLAFCQQKPSDGKVTPIDPPDEDPDFLSTPVILEPLYGCSEAIEVTSVAYGAKLDIFIDGTPVNSVVVTEPSKQAVKVPALTKGQTLVATQNLDGIASDESPPAIVTSHLDDYPQGLPTPEIDPPLIHQCGHVIAVRHVRGAKVTVDVNGADPRSKQTSGDWTNIFPRKRPFSIGDRFTAQQSMCSDVSDISNEEVAVAPPSPMPEPSLKNAPLVAGQTVIGLENLAHGARTQVQVPGIGEIAGFHTAVGYVNELDITTGLGGPLQAGDSLEIYSDLCDTTKVSTVSVNPCDDIPAPSISQPFVGDSSVSVTDAIAGARILVFDNNGLEIGDSSGTLIALAREVVPNDVLTVVQKVGDCTSATGYQISAMCISEDQGCF